MKPKDIAAILLIIAGGMGLLYGGFSYPTDTQEVKIGPLELTVQEREQVNIPQWAGIAAIIAGLLMLVVPLKNI